MTIETLIIKYPKLFKLLPDDIDAVRYLFVIDENYNDDDTDEFDAIDPEDFNYLVYVTDLLQEVMGEDTMIEFVKVLSTHKDVDEFYLSEVDLYGMQTSLDEDAIANMLLGIAEGLL